MMNRIIMLSLLLAIVLTGCGGGSELPPLRPQGEVSGVVADGSFKNSSIRIFSISGDESGAKKVAMLGETTLNEDGGYSVSIRAKSQAILVEISGGSYVEQSSGREISLKESEILRAVAFYKSGESQTVMVSPITHVISGYAMFKISNGVDPALATSEASLVISDILGFNAIITHSLSIRDGKNQIEELTHESMYGFFLAAISGWTEWVSSQHETVSHFTYNSIGVSQLFYDDIEADGFLDGRSRKESEVKELFYGQIKIDQDVYRISFAQYMLAIANRPDNKTAIKANSLLDYAHDIATNRSPIFGGQEPGDFQEAVPPIYALEEERIHKNGQFHFAATVGGVVGAETVEFYIDETYVGVADDPLRPFIDIDTSAYQDGLHQIKVVAINVFGKTGEANFTYQFDNTSPIISIDSPLITNKETFDLSGTISDAGIGVKTIEIHGTTHSDVVEGEWSAQVMLTEGYNTIPVRMVDQLGNQHLQNIIIELDKSAPIFNTDLGHGKAIFGMDDNVVIRELLDENTLLPIVIDANTIDLNGVGVNRESLDLHGIPYFAFKPEDHRVSGISTRIDMFVVQMKYSKNGQILNDWTRILPLESEYLVPLVTETLNTQWMKSNKNDVHVVDIKIIDEAGNEAENKFSFKVDFRVSDIVAEQLEVVSTEFFQTYDGLNFERRFELNDKAISFVNYKYRNSADYAKYIKVEDNFNHIVQRTYDKAIRVNKVQWQVETQWQVRKILEPLNTNQCPGESVGDVIDVNEIYNFTNAGWQLMPLPTPYTSEPKDVEADLPIPYEDGWSEYHFDLEFKVSETDVPTTELNKDNLLLYGYDYLTSLSDFFQPALVVAWTYSDPEVPVVLKACNGATFFKQNILYSNPISIHDDNNEPYPKNILTEDLTSDPVMFQTERFRVYDVEMGEIMPVNNDWYRVPPGHTIRIDKIAVNPDSNNFNNIDVLDVNTEAFTSYAERKLDKKIEWTIDQRLTISAIHDAGQENIQLMKPLVVELLVPEIIYSISR